ncbi:MAG: FG-GAP repeat protein, partial [bacterium]
MTLTPAGDRVVLEWSVDVDGSLLGFHVERRTPGTSWLRRTGALLHQSSGKYQFNDIDDDLLITGIREYRLVAINRNGLSDTFGPWSVVVGSPARPLLGDGYPNPSSHGVSVPIELPESAFVTVTIFDAAGRLVRHLHEGTLPAGRVNLWWDGTGDNGARRNAGSYWYHVVTDRTIEKRKVIIRR